MGARKNLSYNNFIFFLIDSFYNNNNSNNLFDLTYK